MNDDLTVIIGTCDAYLKFIPNCMSLLNKYFEPDVRKIIVGETKSVERDGYEWILPGKGSWGRRMKEAFQETNTKYCFFILDDYYLHQKLSKEYFSWITSFMDREDANKVTLTPVPNWAGYKYTETLDTIKRMSKDSEWLASVQPSVWKTSQFLSIVEDDYNPWDFEIKGSEKLKGEEDSHFVVLLDVPLYFNIARKGGTLTKGWQDFLNSEGLSL